MSNLPPSIDEERWSVYRRESGFSTGWTNRHVRRDRHGFKEIWHGDLDTVEMASSSHTGVGATGVKIDLLAAWRFP